MKVKTCRLCLAVEVKVFKLGNTDAKQFIENVFKENGYRQVLNEAHYICYECKALLDKSYNFVKRVLTAQEILVNFAKEKTKICLSTLKSIDREHMGIATSLTIHVLKNIDSFNTDLESEAFIKQESDLETIDDPTQNEYNDDPAFSITKQKSLYKKKIKKIKKKNSIAKKTGGGTDSKPVQRKKTILQPSKFILSLANVGDRRERRRNKTYAFKEDFYRSQEHDEEFQPDSSEGESSDTNDDDGYYNENGRKRMRPIRVYPRKCCLCQYEVMNGKEHYLHYIHVHPDTPYPFAPDKPTLVCQFCGKLIRGVKNHAEHELTHGNELNITCLECPKKFHNQNRLQRHMNRTHAKTFSECDYCGKKFKTKTDLMRHIRIHTGEKPFKCYICGAGFATNGNVGIHLRSKHENLDQEKKKKKSKRKRKMTYSSDDSDDCLINLLQLKNKKN